MLHIDEGRQRELRELDTIDVPGVAPWAEFCYGCAAELLFGGRKIFFRLTDPAVLDLTPDPATRPRGVAGALETWTIEDGRREREG